MSLFHRCRIGAMPLTIGLATIVLAVACQDTTTAPPPVFSIQQAPTSSGDLQRDTVLATPSPLRVIVRAGDAPAVDVVVYWTIEVDGSVITTEITRTDPSGVASLSLTFGSKPTVYSVQARLGPDPGGSAVTFTLTATPGRAAALRIVAGSNQTDTVTAQLGAEYVVQVTDAHGNSAPDVGIEWTVAAGGGSITPAQSRTTAPNGYSSARHTLGRGTGVNSVVATLAELGAQVEFQAVATVARPTTLTMLSGNNQSAETNQRLGADYVVRVTDSYGNPVAGVVIDWTIVAGGGELSPTRDTTDVDGLASTRATGGTAAGAQIVKATASVLSAPVQATFTSTITAPPPPPPAPEPELSLIHI